MSPSILHGPEGSQPLRACRGPHVVVPAAITAISADGVRYLDRRMPNALHTIASPAVPSAAQAASAASSATHVSPSFHTKRVSR